MTRDQLEELTLLSGRQLFSQAQKTYPENFTGYYF